MNTLSFEGKEIVSTRDALLLLSCSRSTIDRQMLKGTLKPVPTPHAILYFLKEDVLKLKNRLDAKKKKNEKA